MFSASLVVDAKQRCLPELHDVPYDTPPPSNATAVNPSSSSSSPSAAAMAAGSSAGVRNSSRHHHDDLMDEPIYANAAAHPPLVGNSLCLYVTGGVSRIHSVFMLHIHKCASICACDIVSMMCSERLDAFFFHRICLRTRTNSSCFQLKNAACIGRQSLMLCLKFET